MLTDCVCLHDLGDFLVQALYHLWRGLGRSDDAIPRRDVIAWKTVLGDRRDLRQPGAALGAGAGQCHHLALVRIRDGDRRAGERQLDLTTDQVHDRLVDAAIGNVHEFGAAHACEKFTGQVRAASGPR